MCTGIVAVLRVLIGVAVLWTCLSLVGLNGGARFSMLGVLFRASAALFLCIHVSNYLHDIRFATLPLVDE